MKAPFLALSLLAITTVVCFSQSDYRKGYVVTSNTDTLRGLICYKGNKANSEHCQFKKDEHSEVILYTPNDIQAYRFVDGKFYIAKVPNVVSGKKVFLEYLIDGTVDIYYYRDSDGEHYLVDNGDGNLAELKSGDIKVNVNNEQYVRTDKRYIGVLKSAFRKSPSISKRVDDIGISHKSLISLAKDYHNEVCSNESCIVYENKIPKPIFLFGPVAILNIFNVHNKYGDQSYSPIQFPWAIKFHSTIYASFGFFFRKNMPLINERMYCNFETTFSSRKLTASYNNYNLKYTQVPVNTSVTLRYELVGSNKLKPVFQAGFFYENNFGKRFTINDIDYHKVFSGEDYGLIFGIGGAYKNSKQREINFDVRYAYGAGLFMNDTADMSTRNIQFVIRYRLTD